MREHPAATVTASHLGTPGRGRGTQEQRTGTGMWMASGALPAQAGVWWQGEVGWERVSVLCG